jgi:CheY-like chemotaxis protein
VDDDALIRSSVEHVLTELGYSVSSSEDGFSALREMRSQIPNIILSDLNMPGMSGFELLSVVRRRFPAIQAIAMSGAFSGNEVPSGIAADAFYQKGSSIAALLQILRTLPQMKRRAAHPVSAEAPIWIQRGLPDACGEAYITIACPECLRTFPGVIGSSICQIRETICIYCRMPIHYAIVEPVERQPLAALRKMPAEAKPALASEAQFYF